MYRKAMIKSNAPKVLWDLCLELQAEIRSHTAIDLFVLQGETPHTKLLGDTADISHLCQFEWYQLVGYIHPAERMDTKHIGRYLGPSHDVGDAMCSKIMTSKATIIICSSVYPITPDDLATSGVQEKIADFETSLKEKLKDRADGIQDSEDDPNDDPNDFIPYKDEDNGPQEMPEADTMDHESYDRYISSRILLPNDAGIAQPATVLRRKRDHDGTLIGQLHTNPILDTSLYDVEFDDGRIGTYAANVIAENIFEQVGDEGRTFIVFDEILDHQKGTDAISPDDGFVIHNNRRYPK
jgi:hypothetical protein